MRIHYLQHVPFEGPANIANWAQNKGHEVSRTLLFNDEHFPDQESFDWLIVMGGPMSTNEVAVYPWLKREKGFILDAINNDKVVIGICLGAQLIADVLGAGVYKNLFSEIGWHTVSLTADAKRSKLFCSMPKNFTAFHWHGDTFDLPADGIRLAKSEGCGNQAFEYRDKVLGLQFHLESSGSSIAKLIDNCGADITEGRYIQAAKEILNADNNLDEINATMNLLLDNIEREYG